MLSVARMGKYEKFALRIFCLAVLLFVFLTIFHFVTFLSFHTCLKHLSKNSELPSSSSKDGTILASVIQNMALLLIFMLQHSLQANANLKIFLQRRGFGHVERLFYNIGTCITLQILMFYWQPIPEKTFWAIPTQNSTAVWWYFTAIHTICWMVMYSSCLLMDVSDLLGSRQVYYYVSGWPPPDSFKSEFLKRLYSHIRHVSFTPLAVILIIHPVMQLDRLLLAYGLICYMFLRFTVDDIDYYYHERMFKKKIQYFRSHRSMSP